MDQSLKIVVHCVYYPPEVGGLESHVHYLCRGLAERGHVVSVITSLSRPGLPTREDADGVRIWRTPLSSRTPWGWFAHAAGSTRRTREAVADADVVHAQAFPSILPCSLALAGRSTPLAATIHTSHFLRLAGRKTTRSALGALIRRSDHNFAASNELAHAVQSLGPSLEAEVLVNGVDAQVFRPVPPSMPVTASASAPASASGSGSRSRRLVVPRRLFPKNGVEFFVRAMPAIAAAGARVEIDIDALVVGGGPERERLERLAGELGVGSRIRFLGPRPHDEMPGLLCSGDLAVLPSLVEATSVAALESMACGVPVAASNVGGLPQIVDDAVGGLFEPGDPEALAAKVVALLADPALPERGRTARRRVVQHWSNDRLVERHLEAYRHLTGHGRG